MLENIGWECTLENCPNKLEKRFLAYILSIIAKIIKVSPQQNR